MATDNRSVSRAWAQGQAAHSGNMSTNGLDIFSYAHRIGYTNENGDKVAQCCHYSITTTSKHCDPTKGVADRVTECVEHGRTHKGRQS